ncbi:MAG: helix-turn-helix transcriptional regulator [Dehalococcoidia bacterium]|jgi:DNA-binding transcriptional regulator YdaS (Cro superfamily)|nr:helix-turn-helix transcriptional regulator [Dehalococcoidia bacterium]
MHPIKKFLIDHKLKTEDFAKKLQDPAVSEGYISQIICGYRKPSPKLSMQIERVWGIPKEQLRPDIYQG